MVSAGMTCVKYLLFCFNLIFALSGIAILSVGAVTHFAYKEYKIFVYPSYQNIPLVLIVVGAIIFIVAFFGCCGAVKENHCMIITFSVFLVIIFIVELGAGIAGYICRNDIQNMLQDKLNSTMYSYYKNPEIARTWDIAQHEAQCCGMHGPSDWQQITRNNTLPHTCCPDTPPSGSCTLNSPNLFHDSCYQKLQELFFKYGSIIGGVGVGIAVTQLLGVIFACCLARSIRDEYETV